MIYYLLNIVLNNCCFGKEPKKRLLDEIKQDVKQLTKHEMELLKSFMIPPLRDKTYCC